ncbi:MAG: pyridoxamine 5'-phosphate oxidase family protein [Treponema sp.]|nr:pyridoxamine 5'-phosphate oxidase family protein [Treponema sp.]
MKTVYDFIKKCGTYYLATVEENQPRVRPFGTIALYENKLYIQTGKAKTVSKQLSVNPKAELCCFDGETGTWLRLCGELINDDSVEAKKHMLYEYPNLRGMYNENDSNTQVLYFKNATATFSSFAGAPKVITF